MSELEQYLAVFGFMLEPISGLIVFCLRAVAAVTLLFGAWSAARPGQSIALYQALMRFFNWRVEPIDRARELTTTRWLGAALVACSLVSLFLLLEGNQ